MSIKLRAFLTKAKGLNINSKTFYSKYPELAPGNVYLSEGRLVTQKDIDKNICRIVRNSRFNEFVDKIKDMFERFFKLK